jgi:hypothetical protein
MNIRTDIVIVFLVLISIFPLFYIFRSVFRTIGQWSEKSREWAIRKCAAAQLIRRMKNETREGVIEIALAIALSSHHWPIRKSDDDEGTARSHDLYLAKFNLWSREDLEWWIRVAVSEKHSCFLKVATESLNLAASNRRESK